MEVKVVCGCGQKYKFDVEPVSGRMPVKVACPVCGADGTEAANQILAQYFPNRPPPTPVVLDARLTTAPPVPPPPPPIAATRPPLIAAARPPTIGSTPRPIVPPKPVAATSNIQWYQYIWIGLPLILVVTGGCLGGACGGAACAINRTVFLKTSNPVMKYVWTGMISVGAVVVWFVIVALLLGMLQGLRPG